MSVTTSMDLAAKAMAEEITRVCAAHLGADAASAPADVPDSTGWALTIPVTGEADGRLAIWLDRDSAAAYARIVVKAENAPSDEVVAAQLVQLAQEAATAVSARPDGAGFQFGAPTLAVGPAPAGAIASYVAAPNVASCLIAVAVVRAAAGIGAMPGVPPGRSSEERLGAVLDVDLPLVVRFGRTVMPLHAVAELGPGSIIDLRRAPEEPVDLLVGDRVIARGDVVVVGGNYGVRITELGSGRLAGAGDREARAI